MPVFDFSAAPADKKETKSQCTYTTFRSNETKATPEKPVLILDNSKREWKHHSCGISQNQAKRTSFEFKEADGTFEADILRVDARFVSLLRWLGEKSYQCAAVRKEYGGRLCRVQDPGDRIRRRDEALGRGWIFTVYDRKIAGEPCAGGRAGGGRAGGAW